MEKNIEYLIKQLSKLKTEREKELGIFNWVRAGVITFEEYQEVVKNLAIQRVSNSVCEHTWIVNTHSDTRYCSKGCDGFEIHEAN